MRWCEDGPKITAPIFGWALRRAQPIPERWARGSWRSDQRTTAPNEKDNIKVYICFYRHVTIYFSLYIKSSWLICILCFSLVGDYQEWMVTNKLRIKRKKTKKNRWLFVRSPLFLFVRLQRGSDWNWSSATLINSFYTYVLESWCYKSLCGAVVLQESAEKCGGASVYLVSYHYKRLVKNCSITVIWDTNRSSNPG